MTKTNPSLEETMKSRLMTLFAVSCVIFALAIHGAFVCSRSISRRKPANFILLGIFTVCEMFCFSVLCAHHSTNICLLIATMISLTTLSLTF